MPLATALRRLLKIAGFDVIEFVEAKSFLDHIESNVVPVMVLDIWMTGIAVCSC